MKTVSSLSDPAVAAVLDAGGIVVARTDTIYGILARADNQKAVQRVYELKDRNDNKSPITIIAAIEQLYDPLNSHTQTLCMQKWPGPVSIIIPSVDAPAWIRRDNASVAYRMPDDDELRSLIAAIGPLIAPSANHEGEDPAMNIDQAKAYFGEDIDLYVDGGLVDDCTPSQLLRIDEDGNVQRLR